MTIYFNASNVSFSHFLQERVEPLLTMQQKKIVAIVSLAFACLAAAYYLLTCFKTQIDITLSGNIKTTQSGNIKVVSPKNLDDQKKEASDLALKLEPLLQDFDMFYRNSRYVLLNMCLALKAFGANGNFDETLVVTDAQGQGSTKQPDIVRQIFKNALSATDHGGMQQTMKSLSDYITERPITPLANPAAQAELENNQAILKACQDVVAFIQSLDLDS